MAQQRHGPVAALSEPLVSKPFTRSELVRIRQRLDRKRIDEGFELPQPLLADKNYVCGSEYVKPEEMVRRLVISLLSLRVAVGLDEMEEA